MWPLLLDMTKEESIQNLRNLELEAYSHLVSALRAQGPLNSDKRRLLKDTSEVLNITQERYKAEIRRAISDEKLNTIAYHVTGQTESLDDWAQEGRRMVPLLPRLAPQTPYSALADEVAENTSQSNKQLPSPSHTERKNRNVTPQSAAALVIPECSKSTLPFRIPEPPKQSEESKKRKLPICTETSSLAQHLLGPAKISRIQQLYRQRTKAKTKEQPYHLKYKQEQQIDHQPEIMHQRVLQHQSIQQSQQQQSGTKFSTSHSPLASGAKINVLQNISLQPMSPSILTDPTTDHIQSNFNQKDHHHHQQYHTPHQHPHTSNSSSLTNTPSSSSTGCTNENQAPTVRPKIITNLKPNITFKQMTSASQITMAGPSNTTNNSTLTVENITGSTNLQQKTIKMCPPKKTIGKTVGAGQKLIVVSNAQTIPSSSILQRTLSIPFVKNISVRNFEKFKIVTSNSASNLHVTTVTNSSNTNSVKHKVVTVRTNPTTKKVIPFSQLQVLNSKGGIKVLPLGGKIVGKTMTTAAGAAVTATSPMYIMNPAAVNKAVVTTAIATTTSISVPSRSNQEITNFSSNEENTILSSNVTPESPNRENGKSTVLEDILKASGVIAEENVEDYDMKIDEYHISQQKGALGTEEVKVEVKNEFEETNGTDEVQNSNDPFNINTEDYMEDDSIVINDRSADICEEIIESESSTKLSDELMDTTDDDVQLSDNLSEIVLQVDNLNDINKLK